MDACLRANLVIKRGADTRIVLPGNGLPFTGGLSGLPYDFSGFAAVHSFGQYGQPPPTLQLGSIATANGVVQFNTPALGFVLVHFTPAAAELLLLAGSSFTHFLKAVYLDGSEFPLVVGAAMVAPGW